MTAPDNLRELLELAAKAAGIDLDAPIVEGNPYTPETYERPWAPHLDDGDSSRLQVACGISMVFYPKLARIIAHQGEAVAEVIDCADLSPEAIRMAVLRAAAEMGRMMA